MNRKFDLSFKEVKVRKVGQCKNCKVTKIFLARGYCRSCYEDKAFKEFLKVMKEMDKLVR